jgi:hypothetical protein
VRRAWVVGASAVLLAGCAGSSGSGSTPNASSSAAPGGAGMAAYAQCMSEHGVELPAGGPLGGGRPSGAPSGMPTDAPSGMPTDRPSGMPTDVPSRMPGAGPGGGPGAQTAAPSGVDAETWTAAQAACSALAPTGGPGQPGGIAPTASGGASQFAVFWSCMSDHDVTAPTSGLPTDLDKGDATVAAALTICDALLADQATG